MYFVYNGNEAILTINPTRGYEVGKVNWRDLNITVTIVSTIPYNINKNKPNKKTEDGMFPLLKSNLQKQVRRKDIHAVATCDLMLELNTFECLRRISVIAAEDVEISKETSAIVWLMAAVSKGYTLSKRDRNFVLVYVGNLVSHNICRRLLLGSGHLEKYELTTINNIMNSNHSDKEYIAGIFFRTAYGGLAGDLPMINKLCNYVLTNGQLISFKGILLINTELKIHDAAVDFHIYPNLCQEISQDTGVSVDEIRELIWHCSSSINSRVNKDNNHSNNQDHDNMNERWNLIKKSFDLRTKLYLQKIL